MSEKVKKLAEDIKKLSPEGQAVVGMVLDATKPSTPTNDVFAWANNLMADREEYAIQLFFINKNYVVYSLNTDKSLEDRVRRLFLDGVMEDTFDTAERANEVRRYEETLKGDGNIAWLPLDKVSRAKDVLTWIEDHAVDIERFNSDEYDIKRQKGILAKFTKPGAKTFYSFKVFAGNQAVQAKRDFVMRGDKATSMLDDVAFKIDDSSQVIIMENDVFVFSQGKFETLFDTKPHMTAVANRNGAVIDERFNLSMPLVVHEVAILAQSNKAAMKKLAEVDPYAMDQEQVLEAIDEYGIPLMLDDLGKIILMDSTDVVRLLDVLSDNYLHGINGNYLAKSKKPFEGDENA
jgi:hypothetical protein